MSYSQARIQSRWLYLALFLSFVAIISHKALPVAQYALINDNTQVSLYMDSQFNPQGSSFGSWLDQTNRRFRCVFQASGAGFPFCGFNVLVGDGHSKGKNFNRYQSLKIKLSYRGEAEVLRVYLRNFSAGISSIEDSPRSAKYIRMIIPTRDIAQGISLPLKQFTLADWWVRDMRLPTELSFTEFDNVIHVGIDFPYPVTPGAHEIQIDQMTLEGELISREAWYMSIVAFWFVLLVLTNIMQLIRYRRALAARSAELHEARNKADILEEQTRHYQALSMLDQLTNTLNRRGIERQYKVLQLAQRWANSAVMLVDIDHFKRVNDIYGHEIGDQVLLSIAKLFREELSGHDEVGRWGGEEFILICPTSSCDEARAKAERIRIKIENHRFAGPHKLRLTVSTGLTVAIAEETFEQTFKRADDAMYMAKEQGRNQVVLLSEKICDKAEKKPAKASSLSVID